MSAVRMTLKLQQRPWSVATIEGVKVATIALSTCRNDIQGKGTKFSWSRSRSRRLGTLTTRCNSLFVPVQHDNDDSHTPLVNRRFSSTSASPIVEDNDSDGPGGDLFNALIGIDLVGKTAYIRRTFGSRSNAQCFLVCGGEALAKHASFDPDYDRAQGWIRHHAVGPAVLSPVLISGLVGALVEAALPQSVPVSSSMKQIRPLIVGVSACEIVKNCDCLDVEAIRSDSFSWYRTSLFIRL